MAASKLYYPNPVSPRASWNKQQAALGGIEEKTMAKIAKMRFCFNCGTELGVYADYDQMDDCGKRECVRAAQDCYAQEREEAHEQLDRDMGY